MVQLKCVQGLEVQTTQSYLTAIVFHFTEPEFVPVTDFGELANEYFLENDLETAIRYYSDAIVSNM